MHNNIILATDSYKLNHWAQYPEDTETVYSYLESRSGAKYPYTVFFGLQYILKHYLTGSVISWEDLDEANKLSYAHFGNNRYFNYQGWSHIISEHGGRLPLRIKAVPEGTVVPTGNVMMTVENTDPECFWLTNAIESMLTHVWYPSTVATLSRVTRDLIGEYLEETAESDAGLQFMLHDFGYRGASSHESAALGGAAHLINSVGTDTVPAMLLAQKYYNADLDNLAFSVAATEHSVMTALGEEGEPEVVERLLREYPEGILSVVADSYDIYRFVRRLGSDALRKRILARDGVFVVRPDSITQKHGTPEQLVVAIAQQLWHDFGGTTNVKGYKVLDPHIRILWGDGINTDGIFHILDTMALNSFSAENLVFGMGGGLLQKLNRDTQRFAFKASAIKRAGVWHDIFKKPLDESKASKKGRLILGKTIDGRLETVQEGVMRPDDIVGDMLETVFENGKLVKEYTFDEVRDNAKDKVLATV